MIDIYGRRIDYLRISVTDRCNLRCTYCMPPEGVPLAWRTQILSYEEIAEVARCAAAMGVTKIRLTGGEPLVRRDLVRLVKMLAAIDGIRDLAMTTNGILLPRYARSLAVAGLNRVNVSLDAMAPDRFAEITRGGDVRQVLAGIEAARAAGLTPIRLNCVVESDSCEPDAQDVAAFAQAADLEVRFIRRMGLKHGAFTRGRRWTWRRLPTLQSFATDERWAGSPVLVLEPELQRPGTGGRQSPGNGGRLQTADRLGMHRSRHACYWRMKMSTFSHLDPEGQPRMVDVGHKKPQRRLARATGAIQLNAATLDLIRKRPHCQRKCIDRRPDCRNPSRQTHGRIDPTLPSAQPRPR